MNVKHEGNDGRHPFQVVRDVTRGPGPWPFARASGWPLSDDDKSQGRRRFGAGSKSYADQYLSSGTARMAARRIGLRCRHHGSVHGHPIDRWMFYNVPLERGQAYR